MEQAFSMQTWEDENPERRPADTGSDWWRPDNDKPPTDTPADSIDWDAYAQAMDLLDQMEETTAAPQEPERFQIVMPAQEQEILQQADDSVDYSFLEQYDWDEIQKDAYPINEYTATSPDNMGDTPTMQTEELPDVDALFLQADSAPQSNEAASTDLEDWAFGADLSLDALLGDAATHDTVSAPPPQPPEPEVNFPQMDDSIQDNVFTPDFSGNADSDMAAWMQEPEQAQVVTPAKVLGDAKKKEHVLAIVLIALACLALTIGIVAMVFGDGAQSSFFGLRFLTVETDDMDPDQAISAQYDGGFSQGDLLVIRKCEAADLVPLEDIVAIRNDNPDGTSFITQRFVRLEQTGDNTGPLLVTRADNAQTDNGPYMKEMLAGKKVLTIPRLGALFGAIKRNFVVILIVVFCLAAAVVVGIYLYRRKNGKRVQEDSAWEVLEFPQA